MQWYSQGEMCEEKRPGGCFPSEATNWLADLAAAFSNDEGPDCTRIHGRPRVESDTVLRQLVDVVLDGRSTDEIFNKAIVAV